MRVEKKISTVNPSSSPAEKKQGASFREALQENRKQQGQKAGAQPETEAAEQGELPGAPLPESAERGGRFGLPEKGGRPQRGKLREDESATRPEIALALSMQQSQNPVSARVEETASASSVETIQRVAEEVVVLCADGAQEVQIEVDSKVIEDLRISVRQKDGEVAVRLMTDSPQTMQMLQQGLPQLLAALEARHVVVAGIDVRPRFTPSGTGFSRGSRREQSGRDREGGGRGRR
jgi:hypothetical protein